MADQSRQYGTVSIEVREQRRPQPPTRRTGFIRLRVWIWICVSLLLVLFSLAYLLLTWWSNTWTCCVVINPLCEPWASLFGPKPAPHRDTTGELYAVGFSLAAGYGTAAISFRNGTTVKVGRYDGDDVYRNTMARWSSMETTHPSPPYYCRGVGTDSKRQWTRFWRKTFGMAASKEVSALAKVLIGLKEPINEALAGLGPVKYGTISMPYLPAVFNEELVDLAQYAGFQLITPIQLSGDRAYEATSDINYSFCGMRLGDCHTFANETTYQKLDVSPMGEEDILSVSYTMDMLTAHVTPLHDAADYFWAASGIADPWLGRGALEMYSSPREYWAAVGDALVNAMASYRGRGDELGRVIVHGESATDADFQNVLREKVTNHQKSKRMPPVSMTDPVYAAALGAAELGKRCMFHDDGSSFFTGCIPDLRPRPQGW